MTELKTYSVLIAWDDKDDEQGEFGEIVRAANPQEAEAKTREAMRESHIANHCSPDDTDEDVADSCAQYEHEDFNGSKIFGGRVIDLHEGAIWKAADLEKALRGLLDAMPAPASRKVTTAWDAARAIIAEIDAL